MSASNQDEQFSFYVGPRLGTISPWSSKTEDIVRNVGLDKVIRVERLFGFTITCEFNLKEIDASMFYDRMTQSIYSTTNDFENLFISDEARTLNKIDIMKKNLFELQFILQWLREVLLVVLLK